ncbi:hypothetical protein [Enterococcus faecium]|uniref:hypothetical protein n=2 Tax=Enterococcus faecium TaxID=1352 RepID=UPI002B4BF298|nr:hypothetical protein [Enterococcus faecium]
MYYFKQQILVSFINEKIILFSCYVSLINDVSLNKKADELNDQNLIIFVHQLLLKIFLLTINSGSIIYGTDESELILQPHFYFRY